MYVLKIALRPWRRAPLSQIFSTMAVGVLLFLVGLSLWVERGLGPVLKKVQSEHVVTVYLDHSAAGMDERKITDSIRIAVGSSALTEFGFTGTNGFMEKVKEQYPDLGAKLESLGSEADAVVPHFVTIAGDIQDSAVERIRGIQGVESVESSKNRYYHIAGALGALNWISKFVAIGLCIALLTGLVHLARVNRHFHADAVGVLRLWGAGFLQLRLPGMISGGLVGGAGGILAASAWLGAGVWLGRQLQAFSPLFVDVPIATSTLAVKMMLIGLVLGCFSGVWAGQDGQRA